MGQIIPPLNTPNLDHNLKSLFGKKRVKWDKKIIFEFYSDLTEFDINGTFLQNIPNIICAVAKKLSTRKLLLSIYRFDEEDLINEGKPINIDEYIIEEQIVHSSYFNDVLKSTEYNKNMELTINSNDLYIKQREKNIQNHHASDLPIDVKAILTIYKNNYNVYVNSGKISIK